MQPALRILIIPNHKNGFPPKFLKDSKLQALAYFLSPRGFGWWVCLFFKKKPITTCFEMKALRSFLLSFIGRHICWSQCRSGSQYQSVWWFFPWLFSWLWSSTHNEKFPEAFNTSESQGTSKWKRGEPPGMYCFELKPSCVSQRFMCPLWWKVARTKAFQWVLGWGPDEYAKEMVENLAQCGSLYPLPPLSIAAISCPPLL